MRNDGVDHAHVGDVSREEPGDDKDAERNVARSLEADVSQAFCKLDFSQ